MEVSQEWANRYRLQQEAEERAWAARSGTVVVKHASPRPRPNVSDVLDASPATFTDLKSGDLASAT
jgi:hypothetical protein